MALSVISAPTNLGLKPPEPTAVPGTGRAPEALRDAGLVAGLASAGELLDLGVVLPGRYLDDADPSNQRLRNHVRIVDHARRLAERLARVGAGDQVLVLGGDCSLLLGAGLHLRRRGNYGLVHIDGHTDYRNPGNSSACASLAGEDLAAAVGKHWPGIADIEGPGPLFDPGHVAQVGCRDLDEHLDEARADLGAVVTAREWITDPTSAAARIDAVLAADSLDGYWLHVDVDVLDPSVMPAVDSPAPGGLAIEELRSLLDRYWPRATGLQLCVFDPDLDPGGDLARQLADLLPAVIA
ncbi:MAG: arginase family protein [Actinomycetota bacterium]